MILNKIRLKNFYSYINQELELDQYKKELLVIKGKNGAGKSTLFEAIIWGIFGKTIRKSTEDAIVNSSAGKNCEVELWLDNGKVSILRGKKPNKLIFKVNGQALTKDTVTATQAVINRYYNIDYKTYMASMVFGQHSNIDFLNVSPDDKRVIIRNFLALDDIFSLRDLIKNFKSEYSHNTKAKQAIISEHESTIKSVTDKLLDLEDKRTNMKFPDEYADLSMADVVEEENLYRKTKANITEAGTYVASLEVQIRDFEYLIDHSEGPREDKCKACGTIKIIEMSKPELDSYVTGLQNKKEALEEIEEKIQEWRRSLVEPKVKPGELIAFHEFKELVSKEQLLVDQKNELLEKIEVASKDKNESSAQYNIMRFWEKAFSEQGLIKYVIKNILPYFNSKCNYYLSFLTKGNFLIEFDESLSEVITIDDRQVRYYSLSGGEKRKISFAVLLGLKSLLSLTGKEESSLLFVDEVAENLDQEGLEGLWNLLQELKSQKTIFLITHDKYLKTLFDSCKRISVIKENNISKIY